MDKLNGADNSVLKTCAGNLLETIDRCAERSAAYHRIVQQLIGDTLLHVLDLRGRLLCQIKVHIHVVEISMAEKKVVSVL